MLRIGVICLLVMTACSGKKKPDEPAAPVADKADKVDVPPAGARTATFWKWFTANAAELRADKDLRKTMERISDELEKFEHGVFAEIGGDGDDRMLVISADGQKELFPAIQELYASRPTVAGWTIVAFRQRAKPGEQGLAIELGGRKVDPTQVKFVAARNGAKLDISVFIPGYTTPEEMGQIGFVALDHTVGEYDMETKIGGIEFAALDKAPPEARPLAELPAVVDSVK